MSRFTNYDDGKGNNVAMNQLAERVKRLEQQLEYLPSTLDALYIKGRLRTDRMAPANSADVNTFDILYDIVRDTDFEYILIDDGGDLRWRQIIMSAF
mgnify:CR=1 FL=1